MTSRKTMAGLTNHLAGETAESAVAEAYARQGYREVTRRWRGAGGEIDLVMERAGETVFVEVKRARDHATAAARIGARQVARLLAAGGEYLGQLPQGLDTTCRFDAALVDGRGEISLIENAFA